MFERFQLVDFEKEDRRPKSGDGSPMLNVRNRK